MLGKTIGPLLSGKIGVFKNSARTCGKYTRIGCDRKKQLTCSRTELLVWFEDLSSPVFVRKVNYLSNYVECSLNAQNKFWGQKHWDWEDMIKY